MLRKLGVLGDIHCEDQALARALHHFREHGVERILAVGDIADGHGDLDATVRLLEDAGVEAVAGNHDRWFAANERRDLAGAVMPADVVPETFDWLAALPATREYPTAGGMLLLCHGLGDDDMSCVRPDDHGYGLEVNDALWRLVRAGRWRFVVNGHTHCRMVRRFGDLTIVTAGTLHREYGPCCLVLDLEGGQARYVDIATATSR